MAEGTARAAVQGRNDASASVGEEQDHSLWYLLQGLSGEALNIVSGGRARIERERCIRCYCCHEMCPQGAIRLHSSLLYRALESCLGF
ncbi:MAG: 4Fe-4S binding protein [Anaerolineae bacterium]